MSQRYIGSSISPTAAPTSSTSTTGVWSVNDQYQAKNAGNWPLYVQPATTDPYFQYVSMLLPGNGTNGAQNNTFLDSSTNNFTITRTGNTTQGTFTPYGANWSNYFDGTGDYLSNTTGSAMNFGTGDFTVEYWQYYTVALNANFQVAIGSPDSASNIAFGTNVSGAIYATTSTTGYTASSAIAPNVWQHIAWVRSSGTLKAYLNGVQVYSGSVATSFDNVGFGIGGSKTGSYLLAGGYLSNIRVVKGIAVYTSAFTPPTAPLQPIANTTLLTCQSNCFIDNGPNNFAITKNGDTSVQRFSPFEPATVTPYYSGYFDGSGDYLTVPSNAAFAFGTGDFTIEFWAYPTVNARQDWIDFDGGGVRLLLFYSGTNIQFYSGATRINGAAMTLNTWQHIALCCASGVIKLFINGVQSGSSYTSSLNFPAQSLTIGKDNAGSTYVTGYMSNIRIVKGTAVYTSAFTPPTAPVTAITNTSLLVNATNAGIIDNAEINDLETVGTVQVGTGQSKFGGSSVYFPAKTDVLNVKSNRAVATLGGDFTIECWVYPTSTTLTTIWGVLDARAAGASATSWFLGLSNYSSGWLMSFYNGAFSYGTTRIQANTWTHCAWVRVGSTLTFYVNGVAGGTATIAGAITGGTTTVFVGNKDNANAGYGTIGYIEDLRITNGYARYTTNFTPPTSAFPTA